MGEWKMLEGKVSAIVPEGLARDRLVFVLGLVIAHVHVGNYERCSPIGQRYNAPMFGLKKKLRLTAHASCAG